MNNNATNSIEFKNLNNIQVKRQKLTERETSLIKGGTTNDGCYAELINSLFTLNLTKSPACKNQGKHRKI